MTLSKILIVVAAFFSTFCANEDSKSGPKESAKPKALDDLIVPEAIISPEAFIFQSVTIPMFCKQKYAYLIFELELMREDGDSKEKERQRDDLPLVIDTLISDLTPALEAFWDGEKVDKLAPSLQKRISRVLKSKYGWVQSVNVSKVRIQLEEKSRQEENAPPQEDS